MALRRAHVKRIHKMVVDIDDPEGTLIKVDDIWVDVLRIDTLPVRFKHIEKQNATLLLEGQIITHRFQWNDDKRNPVDKIDASKADQQFENANAKRKTKKIRVFDPDISRTTGTTGIDDNGMYVWGIEKAKVQMPRGGSAPDDPAGQIVTFAFRNISKADAEEDDQRRGKRKFAVIKVVNNDLGGLKMHHDDETARIVDWETYSEALVDGKTDEKDKLYLSVEVPYMFSIRFGANWLSGLVAQVVNYALGRNRSVEELFKKGDPGDVDIDGKSTLIRFDPLQFIVNVGSNIIAVEFMPEDT